MTIAQWKRDWGVTEGIQVHRMAMEPLGLGQGKLGRGDDIESGQGTHRILVDREGRDKQTASARA